jgi:putative peptidoglycan lipid II flippase
MHLSRFFRSAGILAASSAASRILGMARDVIMAALFGATAATDAFYVAFRIPNLVRRFTAEGVLTVSFIPVYMEYLAKSGKGEALELAQKTLSLLLAVLTALVVMGMMFAPEIVRIIAVGFEDPLRLHDTTVMTRIMFPYLFMVVVVAFCMGVLNSHGYFFAPAFALVLLNIGIITGIIFFSRFFEEPLYGVSAGVLFGGLLQIVLQLPYMARAGFRMKLSLDLKHPGVRRIFALAIPGAFSMGIQQVNILAATVLASLLSKGSISYIYFSDRLHELVLGVFAVSIGNVVFPEMSSLAAEKNYQKLVDLYALSIRSVLFVAVPATAALMIMGFPIISVLLMHDSFTAFDADMTYRALFWASTGIASIAVNRITVPAFFALRDAKTPFYAALASFFINMGCGYFLMHTDLGHAGLTLSVAIAASVQMLVLVITLGKKLGDIRLGKITRSLCMYMIASGGMSVFIWYLTGLIDWKTAEFTQRLTYLAAAVISGGAIYMLSCYALGGPEVRYIMTRIFGRR